MFELLGLLTQMVQSEDNASVLPGISKQEMVLNRHGSHVSRRAKVRAPPTFHAILLLSFRAVFDVLQALLKLSGLTRTRVEAKRSHRT